MLAINVTPKLSNTGKQKLRRHRIRVQNAQHILSVEHDTFKTKHRRRNFVEVLNSMYVNCG